MLMVGPHASWLRQVESHLRDMDVAGLASLWAMAGGQMSTIAR